MTANKLPASILPLTVIKKKIVVSPTQVIHLCTSPSQKKESITKSLTAGVRYGQLWRKHVGRRRQTILLPFESDTLVEPTFILTSDYTQGSISLIKLPHQDIN